MRLNIFPFQNGNLLSIRGAVAHVVWVADDAST